MATRGASGMTRWKARRISGAFTICFCVLVIALLVGAGPAARAGELTVNAHVPVDDLRGRTELWLARLDADPSEPSSLVLGLRWIQDTNGWFPTWLLQLVGRNGVLAEPGVEAAGEDLIAVDLTKLPPAAGHTYEVTLSYSGDTGAVAVKVADRTEPRVIYTGGLAARAYEGPLHAVEGTALPFYIPVGTSWTPGVWQGTFLPLTQFAGRSDEAVIRLVNPAPAPGEFRFYIAQDDTEQLLAAVAPTESETWIPLPLETLPLGLSELRLDYVVEGSVLHSERKEISVGRLDFYVRPVVLEREAGIGHVTVGVKSGEAVTEPLAVELRATLSEQVWNDAARRFDYVTYREDVPVYQGPLDLSKAETELSVTFPLPDRPGNWRVTIEPRVTPPTATTLRGEERLFSTHMPATVEPGATYSIVVLPDTQHYAQSYPEIFTRMTGWITAHAASLNLAAVLHVGDITNNNSPAQWDNAFASMSLLNDVVPYVISIGNHDMVGPQGGVTRRGDTLVNSYFSVDHARRYGNLAGTLVPGRIENHYALLDIGSDRYLVISLEFAPPDEAVEWARRVAEQHPEYDVILLTHSYLSGSGRRSSNMLNSPLAENPDTTVNTAATMWSKILYPLPNSFMVVGGHSAPKAPTVPYQLQRNAAGRRVFEFVFDWQDEPNGGSGWLGLITFRPDGAIDISVYSPYLDEWADARDDNGYRSRYTLYR